MSGLPVCFVRVQIDSNKLYIRYEFEERRTSYLAIGLQHDNADSIPGLMA